MVVRDTRGYGEERGVMKLYSPTRRTARLTTESSGSVEYYVEEKKDCMNEQSAGVSRGGRVKRALSTEMLEESIKKDEVNMYRLCTCMVLMYVMASCAILYTMCRG